MMSADSITSLVFLILTSSVTQSACSTTNRLILQEALKKNYTAVRQPVSDIKDPVTVYYDIALRQLLQVDERRETITLILWERSSWFDPQLRWNPSDYFDITEVRMKPTDIWVPDVVISNSVYEFTRNTHTGIPLKVSHLGWVKWNSPSVRTVSCHIEVKYFPYDLQFCSIDMLSWTYSSDQLKLATHGDWSDDNGDDDDQSENRSSGFDQSAMGHSGEWSVRNSSSEIYKIFYHKANQSHYHLQYNLVIERKPLYYLFYLFTPSCMIMFMSLFTFVLPTQSQEKGTLGILILLCILIQMVFVSEILPASSTNLPLLSIYFIVNMVTISISMCFSVAVINFHFHPPEMGSSAWKLPDRVKNLAFGKLAPYLGVDTSEAQADQDQLTEALEAEEAMAISNPTLIEVSSAELEKEEAPSSSASADVKEQILNKLQIIEHCSLYVLGYLNSDMKKEHTQKQWIILAQIVDRILLIVFIFVFILTSAMMLSFKLYNDRSFAIQI